MPMQIFGGKTCIMGFVQVENYMYIIPQSVCTPEEGRGVANCFPFTSI